MRNVAIVALGNHLEVTYGWEKMFIYSFVGFLPGELLCILSGSYSSASFYKREKWLLRKPSINLLTGELEGVFSCKNKTKAQ